MKTGLTAGIFIVSALSLFTIGLFMIGNSQNVFSHHVDFYTEFFGVNGLTSGMRVRVAGFAAGQVLSIELPGRPSAKFRLKLQVNDKVRHLIREDSIVTVESDGLVGDKFLLVHNGAEQSREAASGATLSGQEPVELAAVIAKVTGVIDQAHDVIGDLQTRLDVTLNVVTKTVGDADRLIATAQSGKGTIGVLLNDRPTAARLKQTVANAEQASASLNQVSRQAGELVTDFQSRNLPVKVDDTLASAHHAVQQIDQASQQINQASQQINQASQQVNTTLNDALAPDHLGENAAQNIRETLSNVNVATANIADDTEALKDGFFFRGYFKKSGFYSLGDLTTDQYRSSVYFQSPKNHRSWFEAKDLFSQDQQGIEVLSTAGMRLIYNVMDHQKASILHEPLIVEGYSSGGETRISQARSILVKLYLQKHFHLRATDIGMVPLGSTPPQTSGKGVWNGACLVFLAKRI